MWLSLQSMLQAVRYELRMFVALKEDKCGAAWNHLVGAQNAARSALMAHKGAEAFAPYSEKLFEHERNLFPPQMFLSPAMTVGYSECSICLGPYGECIHVAGRAYNGEFCTRVITEITELPEISIVRDPKDKRRRVHSITDSDGVTRDWLTWRPVEEQPGERKDDSG